MRAESMKGISMEIGDYGWIECRGENEKYTGWFSRIKVNGKITYVNRKDPSFMFPDTYITCTPNEEYILHYKVAALDVLKGCELPELSKEEMMIKNMTIPLKKRIKQIELAIEDMKSSLLIHENNLILAKGELYNVEHGVIPVRQYVYGVHSLNDSREFVWENTKGIELKANDIIEVNTGYGVQRAIVTRIEESKEHRNHNSIVGKIDKLP